MNANVESRRSSINGAHMSKMYGGASSLTSGSPVLKARADRNSAFRSGRLAKAIHPKIDLIRATERSSKWDVSCVRIWP